MKNRNIFIRSLVILLVVSNHLSLTGQATDPPFLEYLNHPWVDSVVNTLSPDEKIAQSIWLAEWSNKDIEHYVQMAELVSKYEPGGLVFFQGTAAKQVELVNMYNSRSKVPLAIALDAEWGAGMRLDGITDFPYQMTLGAIRDDSLIYRMGSAVGSQLARSGVTINLAPVADINNNPSNPVINYRSFGEEAGNVSGKTIMYFMGLQDNGILATAKHFPGHGDTETDSHYALPVLKHSRERFDTLELVPFAALINKGIGAVMTAHLSIPAFDPDPDKASTLSENIVTGLLRDSLAFKGLIISDAMNMKAVTDYRGQGEACAMAYAAGNDVLEYVTDIGSAVAAIKDYRDRGLISDSDIELKCRRILAFKYWSRLNLPSETGTDNIEREMDPPENQALIRELFASSLTLLNNNNNIIPIRQLDKTRIAVLSVNGTQGSSYEKMIANYLPVDKYYWNENGGNSSRLFQSLSEYDLVITGIFGTDQRPGKNYGITPALSEFLDKLTDSNRTIITYFGNPYAINFIPSLNRSDGLLLAYQDSKLAEQVAAQIIMGGLGAHGKLPVTINNDYPAGFGLISPGNIRMQFGFPENAGISSARLTRSIDSLVSTGLDSGAYPGCEVMVARKGIVIFDSAYGYHTYEKRIPSRIGDIYDLASVTKVTGPLAGLMVLDQEGLFSPDGELEDYLPEMRGSDKAHIMMSDILTHQAGLEAWIPFWKETVRKDGSYKKRSYSTRESSRYPYEVSEGLFVNRKYRKKIYREIKRSPLGEKKYLYSDLGFILMPKLIEEVSGSEYEQFLRDNVYHPIGAYDIVQYPLMYYPVERIVPTEVDTLFRERLIWGYVHDEGAALMGGYSGNAGLFATALDMMKLFEMYRRMGSYGGEQVLDHNILEEYTACRFPDNNNRRGLGFDKPQLVDDVTDPSHIYPCPGASASGFGHSGFTGTFVWVDPEKEITYVFLSNRVYPTRDNNKLANLNIRTLILQSIIDCVSD